MTALSMFSLISSTSVEILHIGRGGAQFLLRGLTCAAVAAYVIARITVTNPEPYQRYMGAFRDVLSRHDGKVVAVGVPEVLEGSEPHERIAMIRFADADGARRWYRSPEYQQISEDRRAGADVVIVLLDAPG
ncbi:MAG: DUF1330 domain-containing protein [Acidimicrobiia bacterium]